METSILSLGLPVDASQSFDGLLSTGLAPLLYPSPLSGNSYEFTPTQAAQQLVRNAPALAEMAKQSLPAGPITAQTVVSDGVSTTFPNVPPGSNTDPASLLASLPNTSPVDASVSQWVSQAIASGINRSGSSPKYSNLMDSAIQIEEDVYTYTGSDMRVMIDTGSGSGRSSLRQLVECTTLTVSVFREKSAVRALKYINAKGYARGRRTIAGSLILAQFTVSTLFRFLSQAGGANGQDVSKDSTYVKADQLPPFNITIVFADELGHASYQRLLGVEFVTDGIVYSNQDMLTEQTLSYVASDFTPLLPIDMTAFFSDFSSASQTVASNSKTVWDVKRAAATSPASGLALSSNQLFV